MAWTYLTEGAEPSGKTNFILDDDGSYAGIKPKNNEIITVRRMIITIEDAGNFTTIQYGALGSALANGIEVKTFRGETTEEDITNGVPFQTNLDWGSKCYDVSLKAWGAGNQAILVRWTFEESGEPIILHGAHQDSLRVLFNDDFTGLITHRFNVQWKRSTDNTQTKVGS